MGKPMDHANGSVKKWGGVPQDYIAIHEFIDSSKLAIPDNRHRALTHNAWFITVVLPRVFGEAIKNSIGRTVYVRDIGEQHCFEDFGGKFIPTAQDYLQEMNPAPWMSINGGLPSSAGRFEPQPMRGLSGPIAQGVPSAYPLAIEPSLDRAYLMPHSASLFDMDVGRIGTDIKLFERPIGKKFEFGDGVKTENDTNLDQSGMLDYPREFIVHGLALMCSAVDAVEIGREGASVLFVFNNHSYEFQLSTFLTSNEAEAKAILRKKTKHQKYRFEIPDNPLPQKFLHTLTTEQQFKIKPGEAFSVELRFDRSKLARKCVGRPFTVTAALSGLLYLPL